MCVLLVFVFCVCVFVSIVCCLFVVVWLLRYEAFSFVPAYEKIVRGTLKSLENNIKKGFSLQGSLLESLKRSHISRGVFLCVCAWVSNRTLSVPRSK